MLKPRPALSRKEWCESITLILQTLRSLLATSLSFIGPVLESFTPEFFGLLLQRSQDSSLFRSQHPPNSDFGQNPHSHRGSLSRRHLTHALFNYRLVRILSIKRGFEGAVSFSKTQTNRSAFCFVLFTNRSYLFTLFGRQIQLSDRIFRRTGLLRTSCGLLLTCLAGN
jgi:hypothetical protein